MFWYCESPSACMQLRLRQPQRTARIRSQSTKRPVARALLHASTGGSSLPPDAIDVTRRSSGFRLVSVLLTRISVKRPSRVEGMAVKVKVVVDGAVVGELRNRASSTHEVTPGQHTVEVRSGAKTSNQMRLCMEPESHAQLVIIPRPGRVANGWAISYHPSLTWERLSPGATIIG